MLLVLISRNKKKAGAALVITITSFKEVMRKGKSDFCIFKQGLNWHKVWFKLTRFA